jgi:hypothetical protein
VARLIATAIVVWLIAWPCAAARTDVVVLKTGDRITCEIKNLQFGYLEVETDSLGTLSVVWLDVASITSVHHFVVQNGVGDRFVGELSSPVPGKLQVGGPGTELDLASVVEIRSDREKVWQRIDGSLEIAFNVARANEQRQWALNGNAQYSGQEWFHFGTLSSSYIKQQDVESTSRNYLSIQSGRRLSRRWFYAGIAEIQQDEELGLKLRVGLGGGLGRKLVQSNRRSFVVFGGLLLTRERFVDVDIKTNLEGYVMTRYDGFRRRSPKVDTTISYTVLPNITDPGRVRSQLNVSTSIEIIHNFFLGLTAFDTLDSRPPDPTLPKNDYGVSPSLRWKF